MPKEVGFENSDELNQRALEEAKANGEFDLLPKGAYVAFAGGNFVGHGLDPHELIQQILMAGVTGPIYYEKLDDADTTWNFRSPRRK